MHKKHIPCQKAKPAIAAGNAKMPLAPDLGSCIPVYSSNYRIKEIAMVVQLRQNFSVAMEIERNTGIFYQKGDTGE